jgi:hypothetical protein
MAEPDYVSVNVSPRTKRRLQAMFRYGETADSGLTRILDEHDAKAGGAE